MVPASLFFFSLVFQLYHFNLLKEQPLFFLHLILFYLFPMQAAFKEQGLDACCFARIILLNRIIPNFKGRMNIVYHPRDYRPIQPSRHQSPTCLPGELHRGSSHCVLRGFAAVLGSRPEGSLSCIILMPWQIISQPFIIKVILSSRLIDQGCCVSLPCSKTVPWFLSSIRSIFIPLLVSGQNLLGAFSFILSLIAYVSSLICSWKRSHNC